MRRDIWVALLVAMSPVFATLSLAQTNNWIGTASTAWTSAANWSLGKVPDMTQSAVIITNGSSGEVDIGHLITAITISNLEVAGKSLILQDTFSLYIFNELNVRALNAGSTPGTLIVSNSDLTVQGLQGGEFDANGTITLIGVALITTNCLLSVDDGLFIISNGVGNVRDVNVGGNDGTLEIMAGTMTVSSELNVEGNIGFGTLLLGNGGVLIATNADTSIDGNEGSASVTISNGTFNCAGLTVGGGGDGISALTIDEGTVSVAGEFCIGCGGSITANAVMNGGLLVATNGPTVLGSGFEGDGTLTIQAGTFLGREILVGTNSTCNGNLSMSGGTIQLSSYLQVGSASNGIGIVSLGSGGQMIVTNGEIMVDHTGEIEVSAGGLLTAGHIADTGQLSADAGIVTASTGITMGDCLAGIIGDLTVEFGGQVIATNATGTGFVDIRDGVLVLNGGTLQVDQLVMTNACGAFAHFNGTVVAGKIVLDPNAFRIKSVVRQGSDLLVTWLMGPGVSNFLQAAMGKPDGSYNTNGFTNLFVVVNNFSPGTVTNFLDVGGATNRPARYYRARLVP